MQSQTKAEVARVRTIPCPHCGEGLELTGSSTFVLRKQAVGEAFTVDTYHPNPDRTYKVPEKERRRQLAYYWRNRDRVLAREAAKRKKIKALLASS